MSDASEPTERELLEKIAQNAELLHGLIARIAALESRVMASPPAPPPVKRKPDPDPGTGPDGGEPTGLIALLLAVALGAVLFLRRAGDDAE